MDNHLVMWNNTTSTSPWNGTQTTWIIVAVSLTVLTGVFGNILVILVTMMHAVFKTTANALIVNLAVTDISSLCSFGIMIFSLKQRRWIHGSELCNLNGFCAMTFSLASALSISCISINRYMYITHSTVYNSAFGATKRTLIMLFFLWSFSAIFGGLPLLGWSKYEYFPARGFCFWSTSSSISYTITFYCLVGPCCLSAIYCYWKIYSSIRRNAPIQVISYSRSPKSRENIRKQLQEHTTELGERKITMSICFVVIFYYATLAPFTVVNLLAVWKPGFVLTPVLDITTTVIAMTNYALNVFIYSISNRRYRMAIRKLLQKVKNAVWFDDAPVRNISNKHKQRAPPKKQLSWF